MGRDWYEPRDKGPQINEPECVGKPKKKVKKKFVIEWMRHPDPDSSLKFLRKGWGWKVYKRYKTADARNKALKSFKQKAANSSFRYWQFMRFRAGDP